MPDPSDEPLVYTTRGNLPACSLRYETAWHVDAETVVFRETYYFGHEVVKQSIHVCKLKGLDFNTQLGGFG